MGIGLRHWNPHHDYQKKQYACKGDTRFPDVFLEPAHMQNLHSATIEKHGK